MADRAALARPGALRANRKRRRSSTTSSKLLLAQLNKGKKLYRAVVVQPEFDFEAPADANGIPGDGPGGTGLLANAEINGRLTMRDVILARIGAGREDLEPEERQLQPPAGRQSRRQQGNRRSPAAGPASTRRCAAASQVPLRRHPPRGVRQRGRIPEHPRPAGGRAGRPRRPGDQQTAGRSWSAISTPTSRPKSSRATGRPTGC